MKQEIDEAIIKYLQRLSNTSRFASLKNLDKNRRSSQ